MDIPAPSRPAVTDDFTPAEIDRARRRKRDILPLLLVSTFLGLAVPLAVGLTPIGAGVVRVAGDLAGGGWIARAVLGSLALSSIGLLLGLPFSMWGEVVDRRWGLSLRSWRLFTADRAKGFVIGAALTAGAVFGLYAALRSLTWWWVWVGLAAAGLAVLASFVMPVLVEPLFNKFRPMPDGPLRTRLLELVEQSGVPVRDILVSDSSRRTTAANAYVSGFGRTRRLVVWDTTVDAFAAEEVAAVAAHEIGHAARRDVLVGTVLGAVGAALSVAALALALSWEPLLHAAGVDQADDPRSQALVRAVLVLVGTVGEPVMLAYSRRIEARADGYALDLLRDPATIVRMERGLAVRNIADLRPWRLEVLIGYSHPPIDRRMAHARDWAARNGEPIPGPLTGPEQVSADSSEPHGGSSGRLKDPEGR